MSDLASRARAAYRAGQYPSFTAAVRALYAQDLAEHTKRHRAFVDSLPECEHTRPHPRCRTCGH